MPFPENATNDRLERKLDDVLAHVKSSNTAHQSLATKIDTVEKDLKELTKVLHDPTGLVSRVAKLERSEQTMQAWLQSISARTETLEAKLAEAMASRMTNAEADIRAIRDMIEKLDAKMDDGSKARRERHIAMLGAGVAIFVAIVGLIGMAIWH